MIVPKAFFFNATSLLFFFFFSSSLSFLLSSFPLSFLSFFLYFAGLIGGVSPADLHHQLNGSEARLPDLALALTTVCMCTVLYCTYFLDKGKMCTQMSQLYLQSSSETQEAYTFCALINLSPQKGGELPLN